ncbi:methionine synthase [Desulfurococcaceae archaeon MEX13E-LK6-19]|nr:methionine synthase [Desulfurococcaceae archaeon MEX13E-LK6-19]
MNRVLVRVSHVGSFPLDYSRENVCRVARDLYKIGVDAPPYPQMRSFIDIYLEPLVKTGILTKKATGFFLNISVEELAEVKPPRPEIPEARDLVECTRGEGIVFKWYRAPVTGVFTLASRIYVGDSIGLENTLLPRLSIVMKFFIEYVKSFINYLTGLGYNIVFIDEPVLGVIVGRRRILYGLKDDDIIDTIDTVLSTWSGEAGIHVCGRVSSKLVEILAMSNKLKFLNFEFYDNPKNIESINKDVLEKYDKIIAPGVASAKKPVVENVDDILGVLKRVYEVSGKRIDLVSADCGFGGLKNALGDNEEEYKVSIKKLENIVAAVRLFEKLV